MPLKGRGRSTSGMSPSLSDPSAEFVDANVLIRHFTQDLPDHGHRATAYLRLLAQQRIQARMSEASIAEVVDVLTSTRTYRLSRAEVTKHLRPILEFPALLVPSKASVLRALDLWGSTNVDFEDALNVAHMERLAITIIVSFDRDYDRFPSVKRREP